MPESIIPSEAPLYTKLHDNDNVGIIVNSGGLPAGTVLTCGLALDLGFAFK